MNALRPAGGGDVPGKCPLCSGALELLDELYPGIEDALLEIDLS